MRRADIEVPNGIVDVNSWIPLACYPRSSFYPLSGSPSTRKIRITFTVFPLCSTCQSHSQAGFCEYTSLTVSIRDKPTFVRLRYSLGGSRPRQTAYQALSPSLLGLEPEYTVGGISLTAPPTPEGGLHSLPPMLRTMYPDPIPSCSKASQGLSV